LINELVRENKLMKAKLANPDFFVGHHTLETIAGKEVDVE
jgi:hypothetical protein